MLGRIVARLSAAAHCSTTSSGPVGSILSGLDGVIISKQAGERASPLICATQAPFNRQALVSSTPARAPALDCLFTAQGQKLLNDSRVRANVRQGYLWRQHCSAYFEGNIFDAD